MDTPSADVLKIQLDEVTLPFFMRSHTVTHNGNPVTFRNGIAYASRLVYESDSRKLYFKLDTPRIVIHGSLKPIKITRLDDGVMIRVRNASPITIFWDWDGISQPLMVKAFPLTHKHLKPNLPLGKQRVFDLSAYEHTILGLPTNNIYLTFERRFELQQMKQE